MTPRDFIYWLQGYFEIPQQDKPVAISAEQLTIIRRHLAMLPVARFDFRRMSNPEYGEGFCLWLETHLQPDDRELSAERTLPIREKLDALFDHVVAAQNALKHEHIHQTDSAEFSNTQSTDA